VAAGDELKTAEKRGGGKIIPVDSEHSAIFQCLEAAGGNQIKRIYLTASGGAFRDLPPEQLKRASAADALKHPVWNMGKKVTIDSATMANKGLEVIEAVRLFGASPEAVSVLIHRESIIHSMVEFFDGAVLAQLGRPDMKLPINYALSYPKRQNGAAEPLDFDKIGGLSISGWDEKRWPCLKLAYQAAAAGGVYPTVYAAADDLAVKLYAAGRLDYFGVSDLICEALALGYDFAPTDYKGIYLKIEQYISSRL
ncbi:MAG TPA: 1-deoxy-D-xylulose-5-phosphate reductoisomerase, partial [Eubacteriales bacterium]|nr:1-deoxy-D-xylulose-5-phosphate reductoisomerase [Eubacteriales bacterium]